MNLDEIHVFKCLVRLFARKFLQPFYGECSVDSRLLDDVKTS